MIDNVLEIIIADDHKIFREGVKLLIETKKIGKIIAEASNGKELLSVLKTHTPDIILMDISMPEMNGIECTQKVLEKYPDINILIFSSYSDPEYYYNLVEAGAKGFILKDIDVTELQIAIQTVSTGEGYFSKEILMRLIKKNTPSLNMVKFTKREFEVINLICKAHSNQEISQKLNISIDTVKGHRSNIFSKTDTHNAVELLIFCIKHNIIHI